MLKGWHLSVGPPFNVLFLLYDYSACDRFVGLGDKLTNNPYERRAIGRDKTDSYSSLKMLFICSLREMSMTLPDIFLPNDISFIK